MSLSGLTFRLSGWDMHDSVYPNELLISNRANGYGDLLAVIDLTSYRRIPWENNVPFFLVHFLNPSTKDAICADPRGVLRKFTERAGKLGFECFAGCEYEVRPKVGLLPAFPAYKYRFPAVLPI